MSLLPEWTIKKGQIYYFSYPTLYVGTSKVFVKGGFKDNPLWLEKAPQSSAVALGVWRHRLVLGDWPTHLLQVWDEQSLGEMEQRSGWRSDYEARVLYNGLWVSLQVCQVPWGMPSSALSYALLQEKPASLLVRMPN